MNLYIHQAILYTLDEGSFDDSGMSYQEYVAILSGNTDLLEKAKLEKRIGNLASERHAFFRSKYHSKYKLEELEKQQTALLSRIERIP